MTDKVFMEKYDRDRDDFTIADNILAIKFLLLTKIVLISKIIEKQILFFNKNYHMIILSTFKRTKRSNNGNKIILN